jgi:ribosomal protein S21
MEKMFHSWSKERHIIRIKYKKYYENIKVKRPRTKVRLKKRVYFLRCHIYFYMKI